MASEGRTVKSTERCAIHSGAAAVARCDGCGRALCLPCAVPVRRRVYGPECLKEVIGPDAPVGVSVPSRDPARSSIWAVGIAFAVAVAATALPWYHSGEGAGPLGAWSLSPRWSMASAIPGVLGLVLWIGLRVRGGDAGRWGRWTLTALGAAVAVGAGMSIASPPPLAGATAAPGIALGAGVVAVVGGVTWRRRPGP